MRWHRRNSSDYAAYGLHDQDKPWQGLIADKLLDRLLSLLNLTSGSCVCVTRSCPGRTYKRTGEPCFWICGGSGTPTCTLHARPPDALCKVKRQLTFGPGLLDGCLLRRSPVSPQILGKRFVNGCLSTCRCGGPEHASCHLIPGQYEAEEQWIVKDRGLLDQWCKHMAAWHHGRRLPCKNCPALRCDDTVPFFQGRTAALLLSTIPLLFFPAQFRDTS